MSTAEDLDAIAPPDPRLAELERTARNLERKLVRAKAKSEALVDAVYRAARDAATIVGPPPKIPKPKSDRRTSGEEVALVHATDWQCGKETDSFSSEILAERINLYADKIDRLTAIQRSDHPVKRGVLFLGGDMLEGVGIFPGQAFEVDSTLYEQMFTVARIEETLIRRMLATFEHVDVWDIHGNHGRIGRRGDFPSLDNTDRMAYRIVSERFADEKRLTWHHANTWYQIAEIGNYRPLLVHGDQIRSFGGNLPAYGIVRKVNAWAAGVLPEFTDVWMGHFHTPMRLVGANGTMIRVSASPESGNEFAREFVAAIGRPAQQMAFVDPRRGRVAAEYVVHLDDAS